MTILETKIPELSKNRNNHQIQIQYTVPDCSGHSKILLRNEPILHRLLHKLLLRCPVDLFQLPDIRQLNSGLILAFLGNFRQSGLRWNKLILVELRPDEKLLCNHRQSSIQTLESLRILGKHLRIQIFLFRTNQILLKRSLILDIQLQSLGNE
jgi:hypothetical protein